MSLTCNRWPAYLALWAAILGTQEGCGSDTAAPAPVAMALTTAPSAAAQTMVKFPAQPVVQAVDASGNAVAVSGRVVTATVTTGDGKVVDGASATTDVNGSAAFQRLTLGAKNGAVGTVTLSFDSPGLTTLTSQVALECALQTLAIGVNLADSLSTGDCSRNSGRLFKQYTVDVAAPTKALRLTNSAPYLSSVLIRGPNEPSLYIGFSAFQAGPVFFKALVPAGISRVISTSPDAGATGPFTLTVNAVPEDETTCEYIVIQSPVSTSQSVRSDCQDTSGNFADFFAFDLAPGGSISTSVTSTAFTPFVAIWKFSGTTAPETSNLATANTAQVSYTNTTGAVTFFYVFVGSSTGTGTGTYSMDATLTNPAPAPIRIDELSPLLTMPSPARSFGGPRLRR